MYVFCLYVLANPLSYVWGVTEKLGLIGIWIGIVVGLGVLACVFFIIVCKIDWKKEVEMAAENEEVKELMGKEREN